MTTKAPAVVVVVALVGGIALGLIKVRAGTKSGSRREVNGVGFRALRPQLTEEGRWWVEWVVGVERLCLRGGVAWSWTTKGTVTTVRQLLSSELKTKWKKYSELRAFGKTVRFQGSHGFEFA